MFACQTAVAAGVALWIRKTRSPKIAEAFLYAGLAVCLGVIWVLYRHINPLALQVDRWSALHNFLSAGFHGRYPYQAMSHLGHPISGFPGLFLLALPFYALGDVGLLQFAALVGFAALLRVKFRNVGTPVFLLGLLIGFPVFEYELFVRSDLFANMLIVAWLFHLSRLSSPGFRPLRLGTEKLLMWAAVWGLALSTRGVVLIPLLLVVFPLLRGRGLKVSLAFGAVLSGVFLATFLPFYLWNPGLFWQHNPFDVQSGYISGWALAIVVAACCFLGYRHREKPRLFLHAGVLLYATVLGCWILKSLQVGWGEALWGNGFDISYFSLSLPFLLISLGELLPQLY